MRLGSLNVTCKVITAEVQPWSTCGELVYKYRVKVTHSAFKTASYSADAWGSIHDYEQGKKDCDGIGAMVVDELLSAASDPQEFLEMVVQGGTPKDIVHKVKMAEKAIKAAKKFRYEELSRAVDEAHEKGLL